MAGIVTNQLRRLRTSTQIPPDTIFVYLVQTETEDFEKFKRQLENETSNTDYIWKHFEDVDKCFHYINNIQNKYHIVLICSGSLAANIIRDIHNLSQIHSIYIYCRKTCKYESFKLISSKIRGVFDNPIELFDKLCTNLDEEARQICVNSNFDTTILPKKVEVLFDCLFGNQLRSFYLPNIPWCPWTENNFTVLLPYKGQGTIEICLNEVISFEVSLTAKPTVDDYALVWKVENDEVSIGTISAQHNHVLHVEENNREKYQIDQQQNIRRYWLTFYGVEQMICCGFGEIRPRFQTLKIELPNQDRIQMENIIYLHLSTNMKDLKDKMKIFIGREPIIFELPLKIFSPNEFSLTHPVKHACVYERLLPTGHYSPIHNHGDAHGILRVLYGKLLIKYFPFLSTNINQNSSLEELFEQNEVTWTTPKLNQTQQMKNPCANGSCCIIIQCYQYGSNNHEYNEHFDYVTSNGQRIVQYDYAPDMNYDEFKEILKIESSPSTYL